MSRLLLVLGLAAPGLAAQRPTVSVDAGLGVARYARRDARDTTATHGASGALGVRAALDRATLRFAYVEAALGDGRDAAAGLLALDVTVRAPLAIGLGVTGFADIAADGTASRWWALEVRAGAAAALPATPLRVDAQLGFGPVGALDETGAFGSLIRFGAGLGVRWPGQPLWVRLGYGLHRGRAGPRHDAMETTLLSATWTP